MPNNPDNIVTKFDLFYRQNFYKVQYYSHCYVGDIEKAKNIAQDTFYQLWRNREKVNFEENLMPYVLVIARNLSLNELRKVVIRNEYVTYKKTYTKVSFNIDVLENESTALLYSNEVQKLFKLGLQKMTQSVRETFLLSRNSNLSYAEIAKKLKISIKTVEGRITTALKILRKVFKDYTPIVIGYWLHAMFIN